MRNKLKSSIFGILMNDKIDEVEKKNANIEKRWKIIELMRILHL